MMSHCFDQHKPLASLRVPGFAGLTMTKSEYEE